MPFPAIIFPSVLIFSHNLLANLNEMYFYNQGLFIPTYFWPIQNILLINLDYLNKIQICLSLHISKLIIKDKLVLIIYHPRFLSIYRKFSQSFLFFPKIVNIQLIFSKSAIITALYMPFIHCNFHLLPFQSIAMLALKILIINLNLSLHLFQLN